MNGPFGNRFPYTNFHEMNLDWIIQIAKDFLDQYSHIQEIIEQGEADIEEKAEDALEALAAKETELEGLLDAWYTEHSVDIADALADALEDLNAWYTEHQSDIGDALTLAIADFNERAEAKAAETIATIPDDYTTLSTLAQNTYSDLAPEFDSSASYKKWEYVTKDGKLYRFTQDHTGSGVLGHVAEVTVGSEMYITRRDYAALSYVYASDLSNNDDLDTYTTPGNYRIATSAIAGTLSHYPSSVGGRLYVETLAGTGSVHQTVKDTNNREYYRQKSGSTWGAWFTPSFPVMTSYAFTDSVSNGDNLNNYTSPGNYKIATAAIAQSLSNCPTSVGARLTVITLVGTASVYQNLIDTNNREYTRLHTNDGWSDWESTSFSIITSYAYTKLMTDNEDLDDYIIPGNYRIATASTAKTISNYPSMLGGRLIVITQTGTNSILQIVTDNEGRIYTRTKSAAGWAKWNVIEYDNNNLQKIGARSTFGALRPILQSSTYNIAFANSPASIDLLNYNGDDQNVHPKVLYFPDQFGSHYYWMAYTPYPYSFDKFENPCIAYSDDGYHWTNIDGNPIDNANGDGYLSDTHLVYNGNSLECWYRKVDSETSNPRNETIYRKISTNGTTWGDAEAVLINSSGDYSKFLSPAVIYDNNKYCMWVVNGSGSPVVIDYYESSAIPAWTKIRSINLAYVDSDTSLYPWHLDVINENGQYILLVMGRNGTTPGSKWTLLMATSSDNITYTSPAVVIKGSAGWDEYMYRSSIVKVPDGYRIYYSAGGNGNPDSDSIYNRAIWGIGISESATLTGFIGK